MRGDSSSGVSSSVKNSAMVARGHGIGGGCGRDRGRNLEGGHGRENKGSHHCAHCRTNNHTL